MVGDSRIHVDMRSPQVSGRWRRTITLVGYGGIYLVGKVYKQLDDWSEMQLLCQYSSNDEAHPSAKPFQKIRVGNKRRRSRKQRWMSIEKVAVDLSKNVVVPST